MSKIDRVTVVEGRQDADEKNILRRKSIIIRYRRKRYVGNY